MKKMALASLLSVGSFLAAPAMAQQAPPPAASQPVIYLNQAWSQEDREWYYQFSQGSAVIPYDIFLNLEVAGGQDLFRSDAISERYGLITQAANPRFNPDGLPVGLAKSSLGAAQWPGGESGDQVGFTCAACHEGQLNYQGKRIRIHGGVGNTFDFAGYVRAFDDAMQETLANPAKFDRLAARLGASSADAKKALRERFESQATKVHDFCTRLFVFPTAWGPSRIDAIGMIVNRLVAWLPNIPENWSTPIAPSKPPFLWNAPQGLWTQWRSVQQDPIFRNLTEVMGVFMPIDLRSKSPAEGLFHSKAPIADLQRVEKQLERLAPPQWPEEVFGRIDRDKARAGKALFMTNCAGCHNAWPYTWTEPNKYGKRFILTGVIPQSYVGTDPGQFHDLRPLAMTGQLSAYMPGELRGKELLPTGDLYYGISRSILETAVSGLKMSEEEKLKLHGYREYPAAQAAGGRLQGGAARRCLGYAALHAQWLGPQSL